MIAGRRRFIRTPFDSRKVPLQRPPANVNAALQQLRRSSTASGRSTAEAAGNGPADGAAGEGPAWANLSQTECDALLKTMPSLCDAAKTMLVQTTFAADYFKARHTTGRRRQADALESLREVTDAQLLQWAVAQTVDAGPAMRRGPS